MHTKQGGEIESGSLWREKNGTLHLVDDDQFAEAPLSDAFYPVVP